MQTGNDQKSAVQWVGANLGFLPATASVAQSVERWSRDPGSRVQFPAGALELHFSQLGLKMYIFLTLEFTLL